jgi:hypothetical protein
VCVKPWQPVFDSTVTPIRSPASTGTPANVTVCGPLAALNGRRSAKTDSAAREQ